MKKVYPLVLFILVFTGLSAQNRTVGGTVQSETNEGLPGVNVLAKGTTNGTITDVNGNFKIEMAPDETVLVFSYVGYLTEELDVTLQSNVTVQLQPDLETLQEVVVIGYGTQQKINVTGSVEEIDGQEIARQPVFQTSQALAGLAPGLVATQTSGQPGDDGAAVRIRGMTTLGSASKRDPLILVDGIPDNMNGGDPNDIESISILKDAAAAAIYGSRGANGVIIITTKRDKTGDLKLNYNNYFGVQRITQNLEFLDGLGYIENLNKAIPGTYDDTFIANYIATRGADESPDTDWVDEVFSEDGFQPYHRLAVTGGSERAQISASISHMDQYGNIPNFNFKRYNGRFNTDLKINERHKNLSYRFSIYHATFAAGLSRR
ncbi:MAG: SusC/RagA family TonB-linked outer membrane protein [Cytophagales bacterium]|nr:SusC/RagA family TonB-linked outer membrane protein [Cytophagales bacterium]